MHLVLADINDSLYQAWQVAFEGVEAVQLEHGSIFDVACDALVSPANSFGYMDGGLDLRISQFFGWHVQERLQTRIRERHFGELLVGAAEIVETDHSKIPYCISAPTMRVPMILGKESVNTYLAARAIFLLVQHGHLADGRPIREVVQTVAMPGLGTGVGKVPPKVCALQMRVAYEQVLNEKFDFPTSWQEAMYRHQRLYTDNNLRDLQFDDDDA